MDLLDELQTRVLCGDGAMGTLLLADGIPLERCFEELCVKEPDRIEKIHHRYVAAGAGVIRTNSFGANAVRLRRFGLDDRVAEINRAAGAIAAKAARSQGVYVAGSVGPLGIGGDEAAVRGIDRAKCFREQVEALLESGVDLIAFETFMDFEEMEIAFGAWKQFGAGLAMFSFACPSGGRLHAGMFLNAAVAKLRELGAPIVGVNCMTAPNATAELLRQVTAKGPLVAYPSAGLPKKEKGRAVYSITPKDFAQSAPELVAQGARLIGGCCGTTPVHIEALATAIASLSPRDISEWAVKFSEANGVHPRVRS